MYAISRYSQTQASKLGVTIKPSRRKGKKIDVFNKKGEYLASIGAEGMNDYPTYLKMERAGKVPKGYADERRKLYRARHKEDISVKNTAGYYAGKILW